MSLAARTPGPEREPRHESGRGEKRRGRQRDGLAPRDSPIDPLPGRGEDPFVRTVESLIDAIEDRLHRRVKRGRIGREGPVERFVEPVSQAEVVSEPPQPEPVAVEASSPSFVTPEPASVVDQPIDTIAMTTALVRIEQQIEIAVGPTGVVQTDLTNRDGGAKRRPVRGTRGRRRRPSIPALTAEQPIAGPQLAGPQEAAAAVAEPFSHQDSLATVREAMNVISQETVGSDAEPDPFGFEVLSRRAPVETTLRDDNTMWSSVLDELKRNLEHLRATHAAPPTPAVAQGPTAAALPAEVETAPSPVEPTRVVLPVEIEMASPPVEESAVARTAEIETTAAPIEATAEALPAEREIAAVPVEAASVAPPPAARQAGKKRRKGGGPPPLQDEWGLFDPKQCGFAALLARLEEVTETDENSLT